MRSITFIVRVLGRVEKMQKMQKMQNYYLWKVKKVHGDNAKNESARAKKLEGAPNAPPPSAFIGLKTPYLKQKCRLQNLLAL